MTALQQSPDTLFHPRSIAALGPEPKEFFRAHGYSLRRLARRCRVSATTVQMVFAGRTTSAPIVRKLAKLRAQLEARDQEAPHAATP